MIKKYIKKPVIIEAVQWTDDNISEIKDFCRWIKKLPYSDLITGENNKF